MNKENNKKAKSGNKKIQNKHWENEILSWILDNIKKIIK